MAPSPSTYEANSAVPSLHSELMANLSAPDIEGIYETQLPALFRIVSQLGCVVQVGQNAPDVLLMKANKSLLCHTDESRGPTLL